MDVWCTSQSQEAAQKVGVLGRWCSGEEFAHAGEKAEVSIKIVRNAEPVIERVRGQL